MLLWSFEGALCLLLRAKPRATFTISAVLPAGKHLFPFRTEKLSLPGPMVLGGQPPGRVGRRRISFRRAALRGSSPLSRAQLLAPERVELAEAAHPFVDRRVRDEEGREAFLEERVEGVERLG